MSRTNSSLSQLFPKILRKLKQTTIKMNCFLFVQTSIHLQNIMLYCFGVLLNGGAWLLTTAAKPAEGLAASRTKLPSVLSFVGFTSSNSSFFAERSFDLFEGYSLYVWLLVLTQVQIWLFETQTIRVSLDGGGAQPLRWGSVSLLVW